MDEEGTKKEENFFLLISLLREGTLNYRWRAAEALGDEGDSRAVGPLIEALSDPYEDVSWLAAKSLGKLQDPEAVLPLIELLKSEENWNRLGAVEGLGLIGDPRAVEPLIGILKTDPVMKVRKKAAWALGRIGDPAARKGLSEMGDVEDEGLRKAIADALAGF